MRRKQCSGWTQYLDERVSVLAASHFADMCCHRFYVYSTCGHSFFGPTPIVLCQEASIPPDGSFSTTCELTAHPFQSWKIDSLCPECNNRRVKLLSRIEVSQTIQYDEWRWKVSYGMPAHGKDFWSRKAEERAKLEKETGKRKRKSLRFSWKRSKKSNRNNEEVVPRTPSRPIN